MTKSSDDNGKNTLELPAVTPEDAPNSASVAAEAASEDADDLRKTRELAAIHPEEPVAHDASESETGPAAEVSAPIVTAAQPVDTDDSEATVVRPAVEPPQADRPRHNTLASITRPRGSTNPHGAPSPEPDSERPDFADVAILDETEGTASDENEWALADQPTVSLSPGSVLGARPQFLETDEHPNWPPRHTPVEPLPASLPEAAASLHRRAIPRTDRTGLRRYASPTGKPIPDTPPGGIPRSAMPDPRMQRLQELHRRRDEVERGSDPNVDRHVTERVRQWWSDLRPGLKDALEYQHEARASGVHPIPAYESAPTSRLGDVFGRLTASARGLTGRAQSAAAPALKRLHDQAEQAAQAIVGRFEGDPARQQAPFLGPGRIAVFFRSGVSVGQAQRLLSSNEARPLRIIPRKHGFLAYVLPGTEERISNRLRVHPYVRDVVFMPVNAYGDPAEQGNG